MKALVLAAGQGTRLKRLTHGRPKPMLPVRGKPLLHHTVDWLRAFDVVEIAVNVHYCSHVITDYFGNGSEFDVSITYSYEPQLLGTAGAAKRLARFLDDEFVVVYGDVLTNINLSRLAEFHRRDQDGERRQSGMTLALYKAPDPTQCGLVGTDTDGRVTCFMEKPSQQQIFTDLAFSGVMICDPGILEYIPEDTLFDFGHDLNPALLAAGVPIYAQEITRQEYVVDIGTLPGYLAALRTACRQDGTEGWSRTGSPPPSVARRGH